ncbi:hypothetical protein EVJ50_00435 [Synechococcus sp. RSCCF101]|uniref:hypothetical protein n=1 Tax=Synechococcus sp. RSCCF101 TaxID=2511069 RepID=UPI0012466FF6|nr:hypothetical protein [Synechococcus sp. RSCCF101]QEY30950.1 hypothetical protein EVJ50_00435 [Synechococcus sp. RSCCF101]
MRFLGVGAVMAGSWLMTLPFPFSTLPMGELQALNRELGHLCSAPPPEARRVCRIHARLVRSL